MYLIVIISILPIFIYIYLKEKYTYWNKLGVKTLKPSLIFGSLSDNALGLKAFATVLEEHYNAFKNERYFGMYQFTEPVLVIKDLELLKQITVKDFDSFVDHQNYSRPDIDLLWSKNIVALRGQQWKDMRTTLSPAFTASKMKSMYYLVNDCAERFVNFYLQNEDVVTLEMKDSFTRITNDIIASCAFGVTCDSLKERENEFYMVGKDSFDFAGWKQLNFFMYTGCPELMKLVGLKLFNNRVSNFFTQLIKDTLKLRTEKNIIRPDIIHLLMEAQKGKLKSDVGSNKIADSFSSNVEYLDNTSNGSVSLSDVDIAAQALIFFFAGFETSSSLMCSLAYEMAVNPDIQNRLREEINQTFQECNGKITYDALMSMNYMDMVISETLRKWPPVPISDRRCTQDYVIKPNNFNEKPVVIKKDSILWLPIYALQRDSDNYPNPEQFDPERFNAENKANIKNFSFAVFGLGPRNCIGARFALMENKAILFHILKHFEIVPVENTVIPMELSPRYLNIRTKDGLWLGLKKIKKA